MVSDALVNPPGTFFGGAGVAVAVAMLEQATGRRALWTAVQFVSNPDRGSLLTCHVDVVAHGGRVSQARITATLDGQEVFTSLGASGLPRGDLAISFDRMPSVAPPEVCPPAVFDVVGDVDHSYFAAIDRRVAALPDQLHGTGSHAAFWVRMEGQNVTTPLLGYFGDVAAIGVYGALGQPVLRPVMRAASVDNTLRIGASAETEWVLLDLHAHAVVAGYGHGTVDLWTPDGVFLGQMSQTVALRDRGPRSRSEVTAEGSRGP